MIMGVFNKDGLITDKVVVDVLETSDGIKYLNEIEMDEYYGSNNDNGGNSGTYDYSFNWDNAIKGTSVTSFTAPVNGLISIDMNSASSSPIYINNKNIGTIYNSESYQTVLTKNIVIKLDSTFNYIFAPCNQEIK
jgi:hypothetical protein